MAIEELSAPSSDAERAAALQQAVAARGQRLLHTAIALPADPARGALLTIVVADRPFVVDTVLLAIHAEGHEIRAEDHPMMFAPGDRAPLSTMCIELASRPSPEVLALLEDHVRRVLLAAIAVTDDFPAMRDRVRDLEAKSSGDAAALLGWLDEDRCVLLGVSEHPVEERRFGAPEHGLGLLSPTSSDGGPRSWAGPLPGSEPLGVDAPGQVRLQQLTGGAPFAAGRVASRSPVHRAIRPLELIVPIAGDAAAPAAHNGDTTAIGRVARIVLLFTHHAESEPSSAVPVLAERLIDALDETGLVEGSHDRKRMTALYDEMPKDELLALDPDALLRLLRELIALPADEVLVLPRRHRDPRFASVMIAVPRDRYHPALRERAERLLGERFGSTDTSSTEVMGDEAHVQLYVSVYDPRGLRELDDAEVATAVGRLARTWQTALREALVNELGDERGRLLSALWGPRLPDSYTAAVEPADAARDVLSIEELHRSEGDVLVSMRQESDSDGVEVTRLALMSRRTKAPLSRVIGILEHLGLNVIEERPARVSGGGEELWIQDFGVTGPGGRPLDLDVCGSRVAACVQAVWEGSAESDALHRLIVTTELDHQRLEVLRAYRRYRGRIGSRYNESFQNEVIVSHATTTAAMVRLFELRFDPNEQADDAAEQELREQILEQIDEAPSLDHDRILRNQLGLIDATLRTNAFVPSRGALALKFRAADIPALPQPAPEWEVYVYAPHVEGVHLRGGQIARGGLRWSDREDFRTEVFGLMRAQMVKNSVIVPAGAKGGFRLRQTPSDPAELRDAVRDAYVDYISALLDITDDRRAGEVIPPKGVRALDGEDPYLVVAADKGTATFSDTANEVATDRGFWLGDAFASGGSRGYDHKALGITARGAWESVKRHFRERGSDPERDPITVVGIGDMSGDVFGNGLLRSRTLRLIAAYDHRHIFIDPDPQDAEASYQERLRLFELPRSSWDDYDRSLISEGGGVFSRSAKSVTVTPQIREALGIEQERLAPTDLIRAVLKADVDLLWNGGIGTVVKASTESDADAQDRSSDLIRVNADELRASVVGEGGNLGFTQRARIEFDRKGGAINADFIDNSAGVDCSDHEVNLKILLREAIDAGRLDPDERDGLLERATEEVCDHVLATSARQARILTEEQRRSTGRISAYEELMIALEEQTGLVRRDHQLPGSEEMNERHAGNQAMPRPELAVLLSLAKIAITHELLDSRLVDDHALDEELRRYFPSEIAERFGDVLWEHPLRRELLATLIAGDVVDMMGESFVVRRGAEFGASASAVVRSFLIARDVCDARNLIARIEALDVDAEARWSLTAVVQDAVRQVSRWYLHNDLTADADLLETIAAHRAAGEALIEGSERQFGEQELEAERAEQRVSPATAEVDEWEAAGVPNELAVAVARCRLLPFAPYLADVSSDTGSSISELVDAVGALRRSLPLDALQGLIAGLPSGTRVARWANQALRDDYLAAVARLAGLSISDHGSRDVAGAVATGIERRQSGVRRFQTLVREAGLSQHTQVAGTTLAVRQLRELAGWMTRRRIRRAG